MSVSAWSRWFIELVIFDNTFSESDPEAFWKLPPGLQIVLPICNSIILRSRYELTALHVFINEVGHIISCEFGCTRTLSYNISVWETVTCNTKDLISVCLAHVGLDDFIDGDVTPINKVYRLIHGPSFLCSYWTALIHRWLLYLPRTVLLSPGHLLHKARPENCAIPCSVHHLLVWFNLQFIKAIN